MRGGLGWVVGWFVEFRWVNETKLLFVLSLGVNQFTSKYFVLFFVFVVFGRLTALFAGQPILTALSRVAALHDAYRDIDKNTHAAIQVCDPGSELRLGGRGKRRAKTTRTFDKHSLVQVRVFIKRSHCLRPSFPSPS